MNRYEELGLMYRCEYCLAGAGVWCRTLTGAKATALHTHRTNALQLAYSDGYLDGSRIAGAMGTVSYQTYNQSTAAAG